MKKILMAIVLCLVCTSSFSIEHCHQLEYGYISIPDSVALINGKDNLVKVPIKAYDTLTFNLKDGFDHMIILCNIEAKYECKYPATWVPMRIELFDNHIIVRGYAKNDYGVEIYVNVYFTYYIDNSKQEVCINKGVY